MKRETKEHIELLIAILFLVLIIGGAILLALYFAGEVQIF